MLVIHILLIILKILGILLLIAVGFLLITVAALLFVPVTYSVKGEKNREIWWISARVAWLFGGISGEFRYRKESEWDLRILGISVRKLMNRRKSRKERRRSVKKTTRRQVREKRENRTDTSGTIRSGKTPDSSAARVASVEQTPSGGMPGKETPSGFSQASEKLPEEESRPEGRIRRMAEIPKRTWNRIKNIFAFLVHIPGRIAGRIRKIWLTSRNFCDRIGQWKEFLTKETTKAAIRFLLGRGRSLLVHILPRKVRGHVTVGFEDPSMTGQLLAAAGVLYPLYREQIQITPVFDRQVLEGEVKMKGRIFGAAFAWTAWKIYRNQDVRITWQAFRNKEA